MSKETDEADPAAVVEDVLDLDQARGVNPAIPAEVGIVVKQNVPAPAAPMVDTTARSMLAFMVQNRVDIEQIKEMTKLLHEEEDRAAKQTFDLKFAQMQGAFKPVPRASKASFSTKSGAKAEYDYATIEDMVKTNGAIIAAHGFSYHFTEELQPEGKVRRFYLHINGWGHTRSTFVELPEGGGKADLMNAARGSRSLQSYGQRYAMFAGFGFVTEGEDDDTAGLTFEFGVEFSNEIALIRESTRENWKENYGLAIKDKAPDIVEKLAVIKRQLIERFKAEDREARS